MMHQKSRPASVALLDPLYPQATHINAGRHESPVTDAVRFTAVPSVARARVVVTSGNRRAAARAIGRQINGRGVRRGTIRALLVIAARTGLLDGLPRSGIRVITTGGETDFTQNLAEQLGVSEVHLTLPVGPPRANRKPILQVCNARGDVLAYAKVGHNDLTRQLVRSEERTLRALEASRHVAIETPAVRGAFEWYGSNVLLLSALTPSRRRISGSLARRVLREATTEISNLGGRPSRIRWHDHPLRLRLLRAFDAMGDRGERYIQATERLDGTVLLANAAWHGDFNAGNFALGASGCAVWDWERFEVGVPLGFDLLHYDLHRWITVDGMRPTDAAGRLIEQAGSILTDVVPPDIGEHTARTYLLTIAERYLSDDQESAGGALGAVTAWLLPALENTDKGQV